MVEQNTGNRMVDGVTKWHVNILSLAQIPLAKCCQLSIRLEAMKTCDISMMECNYKLLYNIYIHIYIYVPILYHINLFTDALNLLPTGYIKF